MFPLVFISFVLSRRFAGKTYVLSMIVTLFFVSLFSAGFPSVKDLEVQPKEGYWQVNLFAIPLSFPFYACISEFEGWYVAPPLFIPPPRYDVKLYFCGFEIGANYGIPLTTNYAIFLISFFLLINLIGAILGYWINKTKFIDTSIRQD